MANSWIVLLEAASEDTVRAIDRHQVGALLATIDGGRYGAALYTQGRYALQLTAIAADPADALREMLARWADAVRSLGLPAWDLVRTEVFTPEELERDIDHEGDATSVPLPSAPESRPGADAARMLLHQAFSDPLTGLLTEEIFEYRVQAALTRAETKGRAAVLCFDLDRFTTANDRFGGQIGDHILLAVAQRLAQALRPADVLARTGADEYAVLLEDADEEQVAAVASRLVESVRPPITVHGKEFRVSASAGSAVGQPGDGARAVLANAAAAQAAARSAGGDRHVAFGTGTAPATTTTPVLRTDALQDRLAHLLVMQEAAVAANEADALEQAAGVVMRQICAHVGCAVGQLWISAPDGSGALSPSISHMADPDAHRVLPDTGADLAAALPDAGLPGEVVASGRPVWSTELTARAPSPRREQCLAAGLRSGFAFPVLVGTEVVAVLEFFSRRPVGSTTSFLDLLATIGSQLGRVVERQRAAAAMRRSEEQLRQSEARLRDAQAMARLGSWRYDLLTGERSWSHEMFALFGLDPGPAPDLESALAAVHPADRARADSTLSALLESDDRAAVEMRVVGGDGEVRWLCVEASVLRDGSGTAVAINGTSQDITERKLAEIALREREAQLDEAQRLARLGSWECDLSTGRTTLSDQMYRLWGWEPGRAISFEDFLATVVAEDRPRLRANADRVIETGEGATSEYRAYTAEGQLRWFRGRAQLHRDEHGMAVKAFGTEQDITEEKQAEDELRTAKDLYQRIVETTREGIWTIDAEGVTTLANARLADILGYTPEEIAGRPVTAFLDDADRLLVGRRHPPRPGTSEQFETKLRTKGGGHVHVLISMTPLRAKDGLWETLALVTDVTALRQTEFLLRGHRPVAPEADGTAGRPNVP